LNTALVTRVLIRSGGTDEGLVFKSRVFCCIVIQDVTGSRELRRSISRVVIQGSSNAH